MQKIILKIGGMSCSACSVGLEKYLRKQKGIINADVNLVLAQALITYEDNLTIKDLETMIKEAGFEFLGEYKAKVEEKKDNLPWQLILMGILVVLVLYLTMGPMIGLPTIPYINLKNQPLNYALVLLTLTLVFLFYGSDIFKSGIKNLIHQTPNMDTLVTLGVIASFGYSLVNTILLTLGTINAATNLYFESCIVIIYLIKLGRFIDQKSKNKTQEAIKKLVQITPEKAWRKDKFGETEITIDEVKKGDILIVKPGMKVAVDGIITKGKAHFDESFITGEARSIKKKKNDNVIAGSINIDGLVEYKALKIGKNSTISEIVRLVVETTNTKAPIARLADKICGYFVPAVIILAIIIFFDYLFAGFSFKIALTTFVTILVVACPCALGLATPLAVVSSIGVAAQKGILIKSSAILENAHKVDTIIFDKTGTLTYGKLQIAEINNFSKLATKDLLTKVASLEINTNHPISFAFKSYAQKHNIKLLECRDIKNINGIGLEGKIDKTRYYLGNNKLFKKLKLTNKYAPIEMQMQNDGQSIIYVIANKKVLALIGVKDTIRQEAKTTINLLQNNHQNVIMLTGDNEKSAQLVANKLGINNVYADVLPKEKNNIINDLIQKGHKVMMVGDGINDAPSLAKADIGVSIKSGSDIANNTADVILTQNDLKRIIDLITISKKTVKVIKENLFWAFFYNVIMITIATGIFRAWNLVINPMLAGLAMTISSITVILNTLKLRKGGKNDD